MGFSALIYIAFIAFLAYRNGLRAKFKGKSAGLYAFLTVLLFILGEVLGGLLVILFFCRDLIKYATVPTAKAINEMQQQINDAFMANPLHSITVELFGIGGYLLVRYIIERIPAKKNNLPLWPDNEKAL